MNAHDEGLFKNIRMFIISGITYTGGKVKHTQVKIKESLAITATDNSMSSKQL